MLWQLGDVFFPAPVDRGTQPQGHPTTSHFARSFLLPHCRCGMQKQVGGPGAAQTVTQACGRNLRVSGGNVALRITGARDTLRSVIISPTLPTSSSCSSNPCPRLRHLYAETQLPASYVASKFQDIEKQSEVNICATENSPIPPKNVGPLVRLHPAGRNGLPAPPKNRTTAPSLPGLPPSLPGLPVGWPERPAAFRVSSTATSCSSQTVAL